MTNNYEKYIKFLEKTTSQAFKNDIESTTILPIFNDLKNLANHYKTILNKFTNCSNEFAYFVERMEYDDIDFDYYQNKFIELRKIDTLLTELKNKSIPKSIELEVGNFINSTYTTISIYKLNRNNIEDEIYAFHNKITDVGKYEKYKENQEKEKINRKITLFVILGIVIIILTSLFN